MSETDKQIVIEALGGGPVQVGTGGPAPAGNVTLPLRTVVVVVNPAEPEEAPCCLVADVDESQEELADLYGGATAGLASRAAGWDGPGRVGKLPLAPDDEDMAGAVARLGVVRWLQEWSPLPLDWRLLRLEELTLVASLTGRLADEPDQLPELAELCRYFHDHIDEEEFAPLTGLLGDALEQVANRFPLSGESGDWARQLLATWPPGEETTSPGRLDVELIGRFTPELALAAGPERWGKLAESATVDWEQLPRGWVATGENNARWVLDLDVEGKIHCAVAVDGPQEVRWFGGVSWGRELNEDDRLGFDLFSGDAPEPVLSGELGYDPRTRGWAGSVTGTAVQTARLKQGREAGAGRSLRVRRDTTLRETFAPVAAAARRWSVRGVSTLRLLTAADDRDLRAGAVAALTEAASCWETAGWKRDAEACRGLLRKVGSGEWKDWVDLTVAEQWLLHPRS